MAYDLYQIPNSGEVEDWTPVDSHASDCVRLY